MNMLSQVLILPVGSEAYSTPLRFEKEAGVVRQNWQRVYGSCVSNGSRCRPTGRVNRSVGFMVTGHFERSIAISGSYHKSRVICHYLNRT